MRLPSGTVTFLFSDVEGSTRLLQERGQAYAELLAQHRRVLREAFVRHGGVEVDTQGDAFFIAFARATDALAAAAEAQEGLAKGPILVRMGVHTGEPWLTEEGYVGLDVHRAARIAAAGHGGQVLVSQATRDLVPGDGFRDLGEHRLKDLSAPERIWQLGVADFPPLKTLYRTNLPIPATPFLGRARELSEVLGLLGSADSRLLTLTGPGGTGKTRLGIQAAAAVSEDYPDGVFWIPLAPLRDARLVLETARQAVRATDTLAAELANRRVLLVFDNFEHVIDAASDLAELVGTCPRISLLVTSREVLGLPGEQTYPVPQLDPGDGRELFLVRACAANPRFEPDDAIDAVCARLDNLPLALELAAARTRMLSARELLDRLSSRLDLLKAGRGVDPRQQTLRATIEWSHDLLDDGERRLFARLATFVGGWMLEAAERVCDADLDTLQSLVDKSLVRVRDGDRFWMLETVREYAAERLEESLEVDAVRRRHAKYYLSVAEASNLSLEALERGPQRHEMVVPEEHNLRVAIDWATESDVELGVRLMHALENFWITRDPAEGSRRYRPLLERADGIDPVLHARALRDYGSTLHVQRELEEAERAYEESRQRFVEASDERGVAEMVFRLGVLAFEVGEIERGRPLVEESLERWRRLGYTIGELQALGVLGWCEFESGDWERGWALVEQSLEMAREAGWAWWEAGRLGELAERSLDVARIEDAERLAREYLALARKIEDRLFMLHGLAILAWAAVEAGHAERSGVIWSAIEVEEATWTDSERFWRGLPRDKYAGHVEGAPRPEAALRFDDAVEYALAES
jgi:predicted ATPase